MFHIKLKTKNGNDIKKKHSITVFLKLHYRRSLKTEAVFTYRIMYGDKVIDPQKLMSIKDMSSVKSLEDLTLKVLLNLCHIIASISIKENFDPDFVMFICPDFSAQTNKSWKYLIDVFKRPQLDKIDADHDIDHWMKIFDKDYRDTWTEDMCKKLNIKKDELDMLKTFADSNPNTKFMTIDPNRDKVKYAKSLAICSMLEERIFKKEEDK